jgi:hypothetical protein
MGCIYSLVPGLAFARLRRQRGGLRCLIAAQQCSETQQNVFSLLIAKQYTRLCHSWGTLRRPLSRAQQGRGASHVNEGVS